MVQQHKKQKNNAKSKHIHLLKSLGPSPGPRRVSVNTQVRICFHTGTCSTPVLLQLHHEISSYFVGLGAPEVRPNEIRATLLLAVFLSRINQAPVLARGLLGH